MNDRQENTKVNEATADQEFTVGNSNNGAAVIQKVVNLKSLERCFEEKIDKEMGNFVDTVDNNIQNAIWTTIDCIVTPKIEVSIRSKNASPGRDATSVVASSEPEENGLLPLLKTYPKGAKHSAF